MSSSLTRLACCSDDPRGGAFRLSKGCICICLPSRPSSSDVPFPPRSACWYCGSGARSTKPLPGVQRKFALGIGGADDVSLLHIASSLARASRSFLMSACASIHFGETSHVQPSPVVLQTGSHHSQGLSPRTWVRFCFHPRSNALGILSLSISSW